MTRSIRAGRRTTLTREGKVLVDASARCPRRDLTVPLDECVVCPACESIVADQHAVYLQCTHAEGRAAEPDRAARRRRMPSLADRTAVREVMATDVLCVAPDVPVTALVEMLVDCEVSGVPVVSGTGHPVGVVSKSDLARMVREGGDRGGATVADIMMPVAFTLPETATLSQAAALMAYEGIHRIPVVSAQGGVIGLISTLDVVRWLARQDGYLVPGGDEPVGRGPDAC